MAQISVNTPIKIYGNGYFHVAEPCKVKDCPYVTVLGHKDYCIKHWAKYDGVIKDK